MKLGIKTRDFRPSNPFKPWPLRGSAQFWCQVPHTVGRHFMNHTYDTDFGLAHGELRLVPVGAEWHARFNAERGRISAVLGPAAIDIQHIGSTAVPGILAKPILDMAVVIQSFEGGRALVPLLTDLGYEYRGENGIPLRHYFVQGSPRRTHHLHMLVQDSAELMRHLRFRDILLDSPLTAARYSGLKAAIAAESGGTRDLYQSRKVSFIDEVRRLWSEAQ